jgi:hypothetical protein
MRNPSALPIDTKFFRIEQAALQCAPCFVRGLRAPRIDCARLSEYLRDHLAYFGPALMGVTDLATEVFVKRSDTAISECR